MLDEMSFFFLLFLWCEENRKDKRRSERLSRKDV